MSLVSSIKGVSNSEHATGALYVGLASAILADSLPTPGDAVTLAWNHKLRDQWEKRELTAEQYSDRSLMAYYLPNIIWWIIILILAVSIKGTAEKKFKIILVVLGGGAVFGTAYSLYKKDVKQLQMEKIKQTLTQKQ